MQVFLPNPFKPEAMERLFSLLDPGVKIITGPELPEPAGYRVLVSGRPSEEVLDASPALELLVIPFAGLPVTTKELLADFPDIAVHNLHHNAAATAEMAVALMLTAAKRIVPFDRDLRKHDWGPRYEDLPSMLLEGMTVLILGYGTVGRRVARVARGLGMRVMALRRGGSPAWDGEVEVHPREALHALLPRAQVIVVCLPATEETEGFLGEEELALLPEGALLVNVGRGRTVAEEPLYSALKAGSLFAAGVDVWYEYPKSKESASSTPVSAFPFSELDNVVMSPHRAGHVAEDMLLRAEHLALLLNAFARGEDVPNAVDIEAGY